MKRPVAVAPAETSFAEVVRLIEQARQRAYQAVNTELVGLYWQIGAYISGKLAAAEHLARTMPGQRGFTRRNLFRMRQFFDTYSGDEKVTALLTQLPWTHNLTILTQSKRPEEREFYLPCLRPPTERRRGMRGLACGNSQGMLVGSPGGTGDAQCQVDRIVHQLINQFAWDRHA